MTSRDARRIAAELAAGLAAGRPLDAPLDELLRVTGGRATGLWKLEKDRLDLLGFRGVHEMPAEVKREFAAATAEVPLDQSGLGIVKAALMREAVVAELEGSELGASASWLGRFAARRSLAVPIERQGTVVGVIAISTVEPLDRAGRTWTVLITIAADLARAP